MNDPDKISWKVFMFFMRLFKVGEFDVRITYKDYYGHTKVHKQTVLVK